MTSIILQVRETPDTLSELCREYGSRNESYRCPSGCFVCPFIHQSDSGSWIAEKYCTDITPSDWERVLKDSKSKII